MKKRKSSIVNLPTSGLFVRLEQYDEELFKLKKKQLETSKFMPALCQRIIEIEDAIYFIKKVIVNRYMEDDISINKVALLFINSSGIKSEVYQEVFVNKVIRNDGWVEKTILEKVMEKLSIENLIKISYCKDEMEIKDITKDYVLDEYCSQELSDAIENLELEDVWSINESNDKSLLYELALLSIDKRLYNIPEEVEEELLEKIEMDEEEGIRNDKHKRKRKIK